MIEARTEIHSVYIVDGVKYLDREEARAAYRRAVFREFVAKYGNFIARISKEDEDEIVEMMAEKFVELEKTVYHCKHFDPFTGVD